MFSLEDADWSSFARSIQVNHFKIQNVISKKYLVTTDVLKGLGLDSDTLMELEKRIICIDSCILLAAYSQDEIVGFIALRRNKVNTLQIQLLAINSNTNEPLIFKSLLLRASEYAKNKGFEYLVIKLNKEITFLKNQISLFEADSFISLADLKILGLTHKASELLVKKLA